MEIRDPVHGSITILEEEVEIISHLFFQRLRNIKQLGFSELVFPGATHTRFIHSIGVMHIGEKVFDKLFKSVPISKERKKIKETFKLACLLHDIGHAPLSHSSEIVMPPVSTLNLRGISSNNCRQATHEDYTVKIITDSSFTKSMHLVEKEFNIIPNMIADLITGSTDNLDYFKIDGINYFFILHQLVSSELDCDRMDYLLRDSYFCGVSYGQFDLDWLIDNLVFVKDHESKMYLGITERAVVTFDDFLLSRYHMFIMVYFHYRSVCLEQLLFKYFKTSNNEYSIPSNIEDYILHDDHYLLTIMKQSKNQYAKLIITNNIPSKIFESFNNDQLQTLEKLQELLTKEKIDFIRCSSASRLSKYYKSDLSLKKSDNLELKVVRSEFFSQGNNAYSIHQATDLFTKFSKSHEINRLHCRKEDLSKDTITKISKYLYSTIPNKP